MRVFRISVIPTNLQDLPDHLLFIPSRHSCHGHITPAGVSVYELFIRLEDVPSIYHLPFDLKPATYNGRPVVLAAPGNGMLAVVPCGFTWRTREAYPFPLPVYPPSGVQPA